jgi:Fur family iron response transcriptional regulator
MSANVVSSVDASQRRLSDTKDALPPRQKNPYAPALTGCPWHDVNEMLQLVGLRPTRQRMALGRLLFGKGERHITAEMLYEEAMLAKVSVSLARVYNTLNRLTDGGLLRQASVDGAKTYFDTNVSAHHHFYVEDAHELVDVTDPKLILRTVPDTPKGYEINSIDVVVRLRKKRWKLESAPRVLVSHQSDRCVAQFADDDIAFIIPDDCA